MDKKTQNNITSKVIKTESDAALLEETKTSNKSGFSSVPKTSTKDYSSDAESFGASIQPIIGSSEAPAIREMAGHKSIEIFSDKVAPIEGAKKSPIDSGITKQPIIGGSGGNGFAPDGIVNGTSSNDLIDDKYVDPQGDRLTTHGDLVIAGAGNDTIITSSGNDTVDGGAGNDAIQVTLVKADSKANISGGTGDDSITTGVTGDNANYTIDAGAGNDIIRSVGGNINLYTGDGNDSFEGSFLSGIANVSGGAGNDSLSVGRFSGGNLSGEAGNDTLSSSDGFSTLNGGEDNDMLSTFRGSNTLIGGVGDDLFVIKGSGYGGIQTITDFQTAGTLEKIDLTAFGYTEFSQLQPLMSQNGADVQIVLSNNQFITLENGVLPEQQILILKNVQLSALKADDFVGLSNSDGIVNGTSENDSIDDKYLDAQGDRLTTGADSVVAGAGNDTIITVSGNDTVDGGAGDDRITYSNSFNTSQISIIGGAGNDAIQVTLVKADSKANISGGTGDDSITTGVTGDNANYTIDAGAGNDIIRSVGGNINLYTGDGNDSFEGSFLSGIANVSGGAGNDSLSVGRFSGGNLSGEAGNDTLSSSDGFSTLNGGEDNDMLSIFRGSNTLIGGVGDDLFVIKGSGYGGIQTITDFQIAGTVEKIDLTAYGFTKFSELTPLMTQVGTDVKITLPLGQIVLLQNIQLSSLKADDFVGLSDTPASDGIVNGTSGDDLMNDAYVDQTDGDVITERADSINAGAGDDSIKAYAGDDTVNAGAGDDQVFLGDGDDQVYAESGNDRLSGGAGNDLFDGGAGADEMDGSEGIDTATYNSSNTGIKIALNEEMGEGGEAEGDRLINIEKLVGSAFNDQLGGSDADNTINGGMGDDFIGGDAGADALYGEAGNDTVLGGDGKDSLFGFTGNDRLEGGNDDDVLAGEQGNDLLIGGNGNDRLIGDELNGVGNDTLYGGTGSDILEGGAGNDSLVGEEDEDTIFASEGEDSVSGGSGDDSIFGDAGDDRIMAGDGSDTAIGGEGNDSISGDAGNDKLFGDAGDDVIFGGTGNDAIFGFTGNDSINGDDGDDEIAGEAGADTLSGGIGNDIIFSGDDSDLALGVEGNDIIRTGSGNDTAFGGSGNDSIFSEADNDLIFGGLGNDYIDSGDGNDSIEAEDGNDTVLGGNGDDNISGGAGNDNLYGLGGKDSLDGGTGNDRLYGDIDADSLSGGEGDDLVDAWHGNDTLEGGAGSDTLAGGDDNDSLNGGEGNDVLYGDRQPNLNALPSNDAEILAKITFGPEYKSFGLLYQGEDYNVNALKDAEHEMIVINPAKDANTSVPQSEQLWSESEISSMKDSGKLVFGYVNLAKVNSTLKEWNPSWTDNGLANGNPTNSAPSWFSAAENSTTRLADFADAGWQQIVLDRVGNMIDQGFQGVLLDDVLEYFSRGTEGLSGTALNTKIAENAVAMRDFIIKIREFADEKIAEKYGSAAEENHFQLVANGAPYLLQDALKTDDLNTVLGNAQSQAYLDAIDTVLIENYFARGDAQAIAYTTNLYGQNGVSVISVDTDQVTLQQREQIITDAVNAGILPYTTENAAYDVLNNPFLQDIREASIQTAGNDTLDGGAGADTMTGGAGDDVFVVGVQANTTDVITDFQVAGTVEKIDLSAFTNLKNFTSDIRPLMSQDGADVKITLPNNQLLILKNVQLSTLSADDFVGVVGSDGIVTGTSGNDFITLNAYTDVDGDKVTTGNDIINAGAGDDYISGGAGADSIDGGTGKDHVSYSGSTADIRVDLSTGLGKGGDAEGDTYVNIEYVVGGMGSNTIIGNAADNLLFGGNVDDSLSGGDGNDTLISEKGNDTLEGGAGDDYLITSGGNDQLAGGTGNDKYHLTFDGLNDSARILDDGGLIKINGRILAGNAVGVSSNVWNLAIEGTTDIYVLTKVGADLEITKHGGSANEKVIIANYSNDGGWGFKLPTNDGIVTGTSGNDRIDNSYTDVDGDKVGDGNDSVVAQGGNDYVMTGDGNDTIDAGDGNDSVSGQAGDDSILGGAGNDALIGDVGADRLNGGVGSDYLDGGAGNDYIEGGVGSATDRDTLYGGDGDDTLVGGSGNDNIFAGAGDDSIIGNLGRDTIDGGTGINAISYASDNGNLEINLQTNVNRGGLAEGDVLVSIDDVTGGSGNDKITGDTRANSLMGGGGRDTLDGGFGNDTLVGGTGMDQFVVGKQQGAVDVIADFSLSEAGEQIDLSAFGFKYFAEIRQLMIQDGLDVKIALPDNQYLVIKNVQVPLLKADDFVGIAEGDGVVNGTAFNDAINANYTDRDGDRVSLRGDVIDAGAGNDTINGFAGSDTMTGGEGGDTFVIGRQADTTDVITDFNASELGEKIDISEFGYTYFAQVQRLMTQEGADVKIALGNNQFVVLQNVQLSSLKPDDFVNLRGGDSIVSGTEGNDYIALNAFTDIDGDKVTDGNDNIRAGAGNDYIDGSTGDDTVTGGAGDDIFVIGVQQNTTDIITDFATAGTAEKISLTAFGFTYFEEIRTRMTQEGADVRIALPNDQFLIIRNTQLSNLSANDFHNVLGNDGTITGTAGNDTIDTNYVDYDGDRLTVGGDIINAGDGDDRVIADLGDTVDGGAGNDTLYGGSHTRGGEGNDYISGDKFIDGGTGNDTILSSAATDSIQGGDGNDVIYFGTGFGDSVSGGTGNDIFVMQRQDGFASATTITDFQFAGTSEKVDFTDFGFTYFAQIQSRMTQVGNDVYIALPTSQTLILKNTQISNLTLDDFVNVLGNNGTVSGTDAGDLINVNYRDIDGDRLTTGNDIINAGAGNDTIFGGGGSDIMTGGNGDDIFTITRQANTTTTITDFQVSGNLERIDLSDFTNYLSNINFRALLSQQGNDVQLMLPNNQFVILKNVQLNTIKLNDFIGHGQYSNNMVSGTDSNDRITLGYEDFDGTRVTNWGDDINGNAGDDTIDGGAGNDSMIGATGNDRFVIGIQAAGTVDIINDFDRYQFGDDQLDLTAFGLTRFTDIMPLMRQVGQDVHIDLNYGQQTVILKDTKLQDMSGDDFVGVMTGNGTVTGTAANDLMTIGYRDADGDVITMDNNNIVGGAGNDTIDGSGGTDTMTGGAGADRFVIGVQPNIMDVIKDFNPSQSGEQIDLTAFGYTHFEQIRPLLSNEIWGNTFNTIINLPHGQIVRLEGIHSSNLTHSHFLNITRNDGIVTGTAGNDLIDTRYTDVDNDKVGAGNDSIMGGAGNDTMNGGAGNDTMTGGEGEDIFVVGVQPNATDVITDFKTAGALEKIDLSAFGFSNFLQISPLLSNIGEGINHRSGTSLALPNGQILVLENVRAESLTADDFVGLLTSDGIVSGTSGGDNITLNNYTDLDGDKVSVNGDIIRAGAGNDIIDGGAGNDSMTGGAGEDRFVIGVQSNTIDTINDFQTAGTAEKIDVSALGYSHFSQIRPLMTQVGLDVQIALPNSQFIILKNIQLNTLSSDDFVNIAGSDNIVTGTSGNDRIDATYTDVDGDRVTSGDNVIVGSAGNDTINGGFGNDTMTGGAGADLFIVMAQRNINKVVTDFDTQRYGEQLDLTSLGINRVHHDVNVMMQIGSDVYIMTNDEQRVILKNVDLDNLRNDHFAPTASRDGFVKGTSGNDMIDGFYVDREDGDRLGDLDGDIIMSGSGRDTISTNSNNVVDIFCFNAKDDFDTLITNYDHFYNLDKIQIIGANYSQLTISSYDASTATRIVTGTQITVTVDGDSDIIRLQGVNPSQINQSDFLF